MKKRQEAVGWRRQGAAFGHLRSTTCGLQSPACGLSLDFVGPGAVSRSGPLGLLWVVLLCSLGFQLLPGVDVDGDFFLGDFFAFENDGDGVPADVAESGLPEDVIAVFASSQFQAGRKGLLQADAGLGRVVDRDHVDVVGCLSVRPVVDFQEDHALVIGLGSHGDQGQGAVFGAEQGGQGDAQQDDDDRHDDQEFQEAEARSFHVPSPSTVIGLLRRARLREPERLCRRSHTSEVRRVYPILRGSGWQGNPGRKGRPEAAGGGGHLRSTASGLRPIARSRRGS